ncbi:MAG: hypothetical protein GY751_17335 [Bacteroidetes bacterium]|nr:hypothetical protein [Bacteroidota bacterium]
MMEEVLRRYIEHYLEDEYAELGRCLKQFQDHVYSTGHSKIPKHFEKVGNIVLNHEAFRKKVTQGVNQQKEHPSALINKYLTFFKSNEKEDLLTDILLYPPDILLIALLYYTPQQLLAQDYYPQLPGHTEFNLLLGEEAQPGICFYVPDCRNRYPDLYLGRGMPFNGDPDLCAYDYHLPFCLSVRLYCPDHFVQFSSSISAFNGKPYVYSIAPKHIASLFEKWGGNFLENLLPQKVLRDLNQGKAIVIINSSNEGFLVSEFLFTYSASLKKDVRPKFRKNVVLLSGNSYDEGLCRKFNQGKPVWISHPGHLLKNTIQSFKRDKQFPVEMISVQYFETVVREYVKAFHSNTGFESGYSELRSTDNLKHFICLNRVVKDHRLKLSWFFWSNNLLDKVHISQNRVSDRQLKSAGLSNSAEPSLKPFRESLPWKLDTGTFVTNLWNTIPQKELNSSVIWIVTETNFKHEGKRPCPFMTEKTFKPIAFHMPFIIVGSPHTLSRLKDLGYKTFSKWWDESYDLASSPGKRFQLITKLILDLSKRTTEDLLKMYLEMRETLEHNHRVLMNSTAEQKAVESTVEKYQQLLTPDKPVRK